MLQPLVDKPLASSILWLHCLNATYRCYPLLNYLVTICMICEVALKSWNALHILIIGFKYTLALTKCSINFNCSSTLHHLSPPNHTPLARNNLWHHKRDNLELYAITLSSEYIWWVRGAWNKPYTIQELYHGYSLSSTAICDSTL